MFVLAKSNGIITMAYEKWYGLICEHFFMRGPKCEFLYVGTKTKNIVK